MHVDGCNILYIYNVIIFPLLNHAKIFESILDEPGSTSSLAVGPITCAVRLSARDCWKFEFIAFL